MESLPSAHLSQAPWSDDEVNNLMVFQSSGLMHPFTCGTDGCRANLVPTNDGWVCAYDDYTQDWAHKWMVDGSALASLREGLGRMFGGS
jgi:hypothetical protein